MQGDKSAYHGMLAEYARLGCVTASLDFRPSGTAVFPAAFQDRRKALRWLRARAGTYGIDPRRIGVTGHSSGAHPAMLLALADEEFEIETDGSGTSGRVQAAVCVSGVYDFLMEERGSFSPPTTRPSWSSTGSWTAGSTRSRRAASSACRRRSAARIASYSCPARDTAAMSCLTTKRAAGSSGTSWTGSSRPPSDPIPPFDRLHRCRIQVRARGAPDSGR